MGKTKNAKPLTHEEIWDDSALVRSWDEAVEEYRLYHSIHAKGENVEDVLRQAEMAELAGEEELAGEGEEEEEERVEGDAMKTEMNDATANEDEAATQAVPQHSAADATTREPALAASMPMPHPALSQVQDEGLKSLMMAWYFAGYYTGLYEGQQQGNQSKSS